MCTLRLGFLLPKLTLPRLPVYPTVIMRILFWGDPPLHQSHLPLESLRILGQLSWKQEVRQAHCPPLNAINIQTDLSPFLGESPDRRR